MVFDKAGNGVYGREEAEERDLQTIKSEPVLLPTLENDDDDEQGRLETKDEEEVVMVRKRVVSMTTKTARRMEEEEEELVLSKNLDGENVNRNQIEHSAESPTSMSVSSSTATHHNGILGGGKLVNKINRRVRRTSSAFMRLRRKGSKSSFPGNGVGAKYPSRQSDEFDSYTLVSEDDEETENYGGGSTAVEEVRVSLRQVEASLSDLSKELEKMKVENRATTKGLVEDLNETWFLSRMLLLSVASICILSDEMIPAQEARSRLFIRAGVVCVTYLSLMLYRDRHERLRRTAVSHDQQEEEEEEEETQKSVPPVINVSLNSQHESKSPSRDEELQEIEASDKEGLRLNYLEGLGFDFEKYLDEQLNGKQKQEYYEFEKAFQEAFEDCKQIDRTKYYSKPDGFTKLRFLQADKFDREKAVTRLLNTVIWRQKRNIDKLVDETPEKIALYNKLRPRLFVGYDKDGLPLLVEKIGSFFSNSKIVKAMSIEDWLETYTYDLALTTQACRNASRRFGRPITNVTYIGDMRGIKLFAALGMLTLLKTLTKEVEMHYPEQAGPLYLVNAPSIVEKVWVLVQRFLDKTTASKIQIHSGIPSSFKQSFPLRTLPQEFGGKNSISIPKSTLPNGL